MGPYGDIIHLPRRRSQVYPPLPREKRAAQFLPFAALSGHEEAVKEKARLTEGKIKLSDAEKSRLNTKLLLLKECLKDQPTITITYFVPDQHKPGGAYVQETGTVTKISDYERSLVLGQKTVLISNIKALEGDIFDQSGLSG
ncbi:MAG: hypothetical protein GX335_09515 [Firmicutes bacterium]|nr:hypothetical protein [Bacillota bacterium]